MSDWLNEIIGEDLIAEYEGHYCTEDAVIWLRQKPRTIGELRSEEIDWLRWMAANTNNRDLLEKLSQDSDPDVRRWVACNPMTPQTVLWRLAEDTVVFVRRGVAQNRSTSATLLTRLTDDLDSRVRALTFRNCSRQSSLFSSDLLIESDCLRAK